MHEFSLRLDRWSTLSRVQCTALDKNFWREYVRILLSHLLHQWSTLTNTTRGAREKFIWRWSFHVKCVRAATSWIILGVVDTRLCSQRTSILFFPLCFLLYSKSLNASASVHSSDVCHTFPFTSFIIQSVHLLKEKKRKERERESVVGSLRSGWKRPWVKITHWCVS